MSGSPATIGRYRILGELGRGGMSVVYHGLDPRLDRQVAIKVLHAHLAGDPASRERFGREARAVARLHHPHIIEIHDYSDDSAGPSYLVCEYLDGTTLRGFMERHRVYFPEVAALLALPVCQALEHAHGMNIVHRDLKPENIMVTSGGVIKLMDFGIAKLIDQQQQMTTTGSLIGSPAHMAPEQLEGGQIDARTDVFAMGTLLYWLATGHLPFRGDTPHQIIRAIVECRFPDPLQANPTVGEQLARVIRQALSRDPARRQQSAAELAEQLRQFLADSRLEQPDEWLGELLAEPGPTRERLEAHCRRVLLARGQELYRQRRHALALQLIDRLLALDPENQQALQLVAGHRRRLRRRRWAHRFGLALGIGLLLVLAWSLFERQPAPAPAAGSAPRAPAAPRLRVVAAPAPPAALPSSARPAAGSNRAERTTPVAAGKTARTSRPRRPDSSSRPRPTRPGTAKKPSREARVTMHTVEIVAEPFFEQILVDGRVVATSADPATRYGHFFRGQLPAGRHQVVIRHPACAEDSFVLQVPSEGQVRRRLHFLPALLVVSGVPPDTGVYLGDSYRGTAGASQRQPIAVTMEGNRANRVLGLRLVAPDGRQLSRRVTLRAGARTEVKVSMTDFVPASGGDR